MTGIKERGFDKQSMISAIAEAQAVRFPRTASYIFGQYKENSFNRERSLFFSVYISKGPSNKYERGEDMEDRAIIDMYWSRNPEAIRRTSEKYGSYCRTIAWNILPDRRDAEECVNDTWLNAWNAMPDDRPNLLAQYLGKITRNLSFNRWRASRAEKRGGGEMPLVLDELTECISPANTLQAVEAAELEETINRFLHTLTEQNCNIFLRRYWFAEPMADIANRYGMRENTVRTNLFRSREKLKRYLEEEGLL